MPVPRTYVWVAGIALGIGLWLTINGSLPTAAPILILAGVLITISGLLLIVNAIKSLNQPREFLSSLILPLILGLGLGVLLLWIEHAGRYMLFPYPLDDGEGFVLNQALRLASRQPLYPPIDSPPFVVTNYPPFFQAILSVFADPRNPSFAAGRMLSAISSIAVMVAAAGCVRAATGNRWAGWTSALLVLASPVIYFWGPLLRVDVLATALSLIAVWIAMAAKGPRVFWSLPFVLAAIYTRQSSVEAAAAIALALLFGRLNGRSDEEAPARLGVLYVMAWIAGLLAIFILLQLWTGGEFWRHTVEYTRTRFFPQRILSAGQYILPSHALIILLALFALPRALTDPRRRILGFFFIASFLTALLSGKVGSDLNYFLNFIAASACLVGLLAADLFKAASDSNTPSRWLIPAMLLLPAALVQSGLMEGSRAFSFTPIGEDFQSGRHIVEILSDANGPILSEDEGFCLLSGHEVLFNPFIMSEMAREEIWDQTPFVQVIRDREFDIIMLRFDVNDPGNDDRPGVGTHAGWDRFTNSMESAIAENYEIDYSVGPVYMRRWWFIYRPIAEEDETGVTDTPASTIESSEGSNLLEGGS